MSTFPFTEKNQSESTSASKTAIFSYVVDYAIIIIFLTLFYSIDTIEPFHQEFSLRNYNLQYQFAEHERVTSLELFLISLVAPAAIIIVYTLIIEGIFSNTRSWKRSHTFKNRLWELNCGLLGLGLSVSLTYVITGSLKNAIGKPRPDLIDRCKPRFQQDPQPFGLSNFTVCTQPDNKLLNDGFRSFPSGHSSTSFSGLFYLSLYLAGKMHILDSRGEVWKLFIILVPSLGAALVAGTRIMDARHHPVDVLFGSALGIVIAWAAYRQYFPSISNFRAKGRAYPLRTWGRELNQSSGTDADFDYRPPVAEDEELQNTGNVPLNSGDHTGSNGSTVNHFRDVIQKSQRRRKHSVRQGESSGYTQPQDPSSNVASYPADPRHFDQNNFEDVSPVSEGYELQHQYSLNHPGRNSYYDSYSNELETQDTAYNPHMPIPVRRLPTMRSPAGTRVSNPVEVLTQRAEAIPGELLEGRNQEDQLSPSRRVVGS